jgi:hypothetical protein
LLGTGGVRRGVGGRVTLSEAYQASGLDRVEIDHSKAIGLTGRHGFVSFNL